METQEEKGKSEDQANNGSKRLNGRSNVAAEPKGRATLSTPFRRGPGLAAGQMVFWQSEEGRCHYTPIQDVLATSRIYSGFFAGPSLETGLGAVSLFGRSTVKEPIVEVTTREGMTVKLARPHGLLTIGNDGTLRKIQPEEVVEGETLIPRAQPSIPFGTGPTTLEMRTKSGRGKQLNVELGRDAGFIFGIFAAEGSTSGKHDRHIAIAATEADIQQRTVEVYEEWGLTPNLYDDYVATTCTALGRTLAEMCGTGAQNKRIPDLLWTAPPAFRDGFISGYICGDGTIGDGGISVSTASREMAEGMVFLFGSMGMWASYRTYDRGEYLDRHRVKIYHEWIENFPELALTRKQKAVQKIEDSKTTRSRDRVPVPKSLNTEVAQAMTNNDVPRHGVYTKGYVSRPRLEQVYSDLPSPMQKLVNAPIWWEIVESVEDTGSVQHTYNLGMRWGHDCVVTGGLLARSTHL